MIQNTILYCRVSQKSCWKHLCPNSIASGLCYSHTKHTAWLYDGITLEGHWKSSLTHLQVSNQYIINIMRHNNLFQLLTFRTVQAYLRMISLGYLSGDGREKLIWSFPRMWNLSNVESFIVLQRKELVKKKIKKTNKTAKAYLYCLLCLKESSWLGTSFNFKKNYYSGNRHQCRAATAVLI